MISQAKVTRIVIKATDKDGKPYLTKGSNKPYSKVGIQTDKTGDEWYSTLSFKADDKEALLKAGDEKIFVFETNEGGYKNFRLASKLDLLEARVEKLEYLAKNAGKTSAGTPVPFSDGAPDISADDIPFE